MDADFLLNFGGSLASLAIGLGIYVVYMRCVHSRCNIHNSWMDCDSPEVKEIKFQKQKTVLKKALQEIRVETARDNINGSSV